MERREKLSDIRDNESVAIVLLCQKKEERQTKTGKPYVEITVSDGKNGALEILRVWDRMSADVGLEAGSLFTGTVCARPFNGGMTYDLTYWTPAPDGTKIEAFLKTAPFDAGKMYEGILKILRRNVPKTGSEMTLIDLVEKIYEENKGQLLRWPGATDGPYAVIGGLLWKIYYTVGHIEEMAKQYGCDKELSLAGAALYDIGKLASIDSGPIGNAEFSMRGSLLGCASLGMAMLEEAAADGGYNREKLDLLLNIVGPMHSRTKEAELVFRLAGIDDAMRLYAAAEKTVEPGEITNVVSGIGGPVYRPSFRP